MAELDAVSALAAGHGLEARLVALQLRQRHLTVDGDATQTLGLAAADASAAAREIPGQVAHGAVLGKDADLNDRLQDHGPGLVHGILKGLSAGGGKGDVLGVHGVVFAVIDGYAHVL